MTPPQATALPPTELLDRLGTHLTRHIGSGVEYADIRTYVPGDQLRTVNWPVSARRGRLHVTQRLTDRSAEVVVLVDGYPQPAGPATLSTERTVRGAAQVVPHRKTRAGSHRTFFVNSASRTASAIALVIEGARIPFCGRGGKNADFT